ncbi:MAG: dihydropteroate synthase [Nitrospirae bacterium]|nr:dihydropteroate synthase [Nitrospirota bacterium]
MKSNYRIRCGKYLLNLKKRPYIMGILNVTPDSFSDGGLYLNIEKAVEHARRMAAEGADIIDIGGESSRPGAGSVSLNEELKRVIPVIEALSRKIDVPISIDTYKAEAARQSLNAGASIINDISGLRFDPMMVKVAAEANAPVIIMHMKGIPRDMQKRPLYKDVVKEIISFFKERISYAIKNGIKKNKIIIDPGIGFGKTVRHNLEIIKRLGEFRSLGVPILLGPSRKSFIGRILDAAPEKRMEGTAAVVAIGIANGANIVRVHDVKAMADVAKATDAIMRG